MYDKLTALTKVGYLGGQFEFQNDDLIKHPIIKYDNNYLKSLLMHLTFGVIYKIIHLQIIWFDENSNT